MPIMKDETWYRHANPISGLTRILTLPFVFISIWFMQDFLNDPLSFWYPLALLVGVGVWAWVNPRIFPKPKTYDNYLSRGVLGEKLWTELPKRLDAPLILNLLSGFFALGAVYFAFIKGFWAMMFFGSTSFLLKMWFVDRVVILYDQHFKRVKATVTEVDVKENIR